MVDAPRAERLAAELPGWRLDGETLSAAYAFPDFAAAFAAATRVACLAERAGHHPELTVLWGRLQVRITTHDAGRLTEKDVALARATTEALGRPSASSVR